MPLRSVVSRSLLLLTLAACEGAAPPPVAPVPTPAATPRAVAAGPTTPEPRPAAAACDASALSPAVRDALEAIRRDELARADAILLARLEATPTDLAADTLLDATRGLVERERPARTASIAKAPRVALLGTPAPPRAAPSTPPPTITVLRPQSIKEVVARLMTRAGDWDSMRRFAPPPPNEPEEGRGSRLFRFEHPEHVVLVDGQAAATELVVTGPRSAPRVFTTTLGPVAWARLVGDLLVVVGSSGGATGRDPRATSVVRVHDATAGTLVWQAPASSAVVVGEHVLTEGPKGVVVRALATGAEVTMVPLADPPRRLLAATVDEDGTVVAEGGKGGSELRVEPKGKTAPPSLAAIDPDGPLGPASVCAVGSAYELVGRRDLAGLEAAVARLRTTERDSPLVRHLEKARARLEAWTRGQPADVVDLLREPPVVLPSPPWARTAPPGARTGPERRVVFTKKLSEAFRHWEVERPKSVRRGDPLSIAPAEQGRVPPGARTDLPRFFGVASLVGARPIGGNVEDALIRYAGRWLAVVRGQRAEKVFDLDAYQKPPITKPEHAFDGAPTWVDDAELRGDTLYLCNGGGSYAEMARGKKGYVTALAYPSGQLRWQSDPVVCGGDLLFWRGYVITGYGFTSEPDFVYALRVDDGKVVGRFPVDTAPEMMQLDGDVLTVHTYERRWVFDLAER